MKLTKTKLREIIKEEISRLNEKTQWIGPFVFNEKTDISELIEMYEAAVSGYANWGKGMQYKKSEYRKAADEIEKLLKKRWKDMNSNQRTLMRQRGI